jgi:hypothetical protein
MMVRIAEFTSLVLLAICLMPAGAHVFEMPGKMAMDRDAYFAAQAIYSGRALFGIAIGLGIVTLIVYMADARQWPAGVVRGGGGGAVGRRARLVFPPGLSDERGDAELDRGSRQLAGGAREWESGHAVNAALTFLSFLALCLAVVLRR